MWTKRQYPCLLWEKNLTLAKTIDLCRGEEATLRHVQGKASDTADNPIVVTAIKQSFEARPKTGTGKNFPTAKHQSQSGQSYKQSEKTCLFCGRKHPMLKSKCPAYGKTCNRCRQPNHFSPCCPKSKKPSRAVNAVSPSTEDTDHYQAATAADSCNYYIAHVTNGQHNADTIYAEMLVSARPTKFLVNSGAACNMLPLSKLPSGTCLQKTQKVLRTYNGSTLPTEGTAEVNLVNHLNQKCHVLTFEVVNEHHRPVLVAKAVQEMNLLTVNEGNFKHIDPVHVSKQPLSSTKSENLEKYTTVFKDNIGSLPGPSVHLTLDTHVDRVIMPARGVPLSLEEPVKAELACLVSKGVLAPVDKASRCVSQMAVAVKPAGDLRICLDPRGLNKALVRERHTLPTLDFMLHKLQGARVFSKGDLRHGYWHLKLDEASSVLTAMATPFATYKWRRLPFGLNLSSEIFQKRMQAALKDLPNLQVIADDVLICGYGQMTADAMRNHDEAMDAFLKRCQELNIVPNPDKFVYKTTMVLFMGHLLTDQGIKIDQSKVQAIVDMPNPENASAVCHLNGCVKFLSRYIPHLADLNKPLRDLTKKETAFKWEAHHSAAVNKLKNALTTAPTLAYFDTNAPVTIQSDASNLGLGGCIMQHGRPVAYASRPLTDAEHHKSAMEKELLAAVFLMTKFDQMTYGRHVTVHSDHKPLASILKKPLSKAPH